jgi:hypothetical protein
VHRDRGEPEAIVSGLDHKTMCVLETALEYANIEYVAVRLTVLEGAAIQTDDSGHRIGLVGRRSKTVTVCIAAVQCGDDGWQFRVFDPDDATVSVEGVLPWGINATRTMRRLKRSTR